MHKLLFVVSVLAVAGANDAADEIITVSPPTCRGQTEVYVTRGFYPNCRRLCEQIVSQGTRVSIWIPVRCACRSDSTRVPRIACNDICKCPVVCWRRDN